MVVEGARDWRQGAPAIAVGGNSRTRGGMENLPETLEMSSAKPFAYSKCYLSTVMTNGSSGAIRRRADLALPLGTVR